jgi:hypothetical protein
LLSVPPAWNGTTRNCASDFFPVTRLARARRTAAEPRQPMQARPELCQAPRLDYAVCGRPQRRGAHSRHQLGSLPLAHKQQPDSEQKQKLQTGKRNYLEHPIRHSDRLLRATAPRSQLEIRVAGQVARGYAGLRKQLQAGAEGRGLTRIRQVRGTPSSNLAWSDTPCAHRRFSASICGERKLL